MNRIYHHTIVTLAAFSLSIGVCDVAAQPRPSDKPDAPIVLQHPWSKKKVAYLGDSITDPKNKCASKKFWQCLQEWLGIEPYVYGVSGRRWNDIPRQAEKLKAEHGDDFDAIIVFVGTNDFNGATPIGEWWTYTEDTVSYARHAKVQRELRRQRRPSMDKSTYRGCINIAIDKLKRMYPTKQIVLLTPLHRGYATFSADNVQPAENVQNACHEWIDEYVNSVVEAGSIWSVPVIDWNALSGINPMVEQQRIYFSNAENDQLHPNDLGHRRLAQLLMWQLINIPATF
ncbi:MAG: SGNH/GDSL hydrolase family protein [Bacteroidales bacterium]|nr:SGNH/GDSL hydrolase family protein [Bacteroidales bacterium]